MSVAAVCAEIMFSYSVTGTGLSYSWMCTFTVASAADGVDHCTLRRDICRVFRSIYWYIWRNIGASLDENQKAGISTIPLGNCLCSFLQFSPVLVCLSSLTQSMWTDWHEIYRGGYASPEEKLIVFGGDLNHCLNPAIFWVVPHQDKKSINIFACNSTNNKINVEPWQVNALWMFSSLDTWCRCCLRVRNHLQL